METRKLGGQGLVVSKIGTGCVNAQGCYGATYDDTQATRLLERAFELGVTLFDTAEIYGPYTNEVFVGKTLKSVRDRVVIATKFGYVIPKQGRMPEGVNSKPEHIRQVCDAALQRLDIETIDVFIQHRVDPNVPIEDVAGTVGDLIRAGKVRYFGLSEAGCATIRRAHAVHPISVVQSEYSLWSRDQEKEVIPLCRELDIGFVAYSPLGRGFLAARASDLVDNDIRKFFPRWQGEALTRNLSLFDALTKLARGWGRTPAQLALAWLLHQGNYIVPIPGTSKIHRLEENLGAAAIRLTQDDVAAIEAAMPVAAVKGARYDEVNLAQTNL